ncbi:hypothetical protein [Hymenobacter sp. YC55]|uniref:hypothetical protein n=1 Tax=Hymenobacter sp. YC55 TaxID=3034019 RepID=UPI0023F764DC|nr:hypothetical protein [Hymenobacter sp. YC55]MDF7810044.1 hypothetical protein [Hymenobacter sp. YC55]
MMLKEIGFYSLVVLCALLVAIPVFAVARYIIRRFRPAQPHSNRIAILAAIVATPILCVAGLYLMLAIYLYYPHRDFNSDRWAAEKMKRYEMMKDLQDSHRLLGLSEKEVAALLGAPDQQTDQYWEYYLGMTPKLIPIDGDALSLEFRDGKVVRFFVHET